MRSLKFTILKDSSRTEPQKIKLSQNAKLIGFTSRLKNLAIILEDKGTKSIYYTHSSRKGFVKNDPLEFEKIWLEYASSDKDYQVQVLVD